MFEFLNGFLRNRNNAAVNYGPARRGGAAKASSFGPYNDDYRVRKTPLRFTGLRTFNIINSEGEYITINTNSDDNFRGPTWDHIISSYQSGMPIAGVVSKKVTARDDQSKILGYVVEIHADKSNHIVTAFMPARFSGFKLKNGDIVVFMIKEFDPLLSRRKYSLVIQMIEHIPVRFL
ncbi:MAG: hypothetical protein BWY32_03700 [bacterium ADurb.Bin243]|nr:MAG: hypothetical protein BWY32_03700 [bacterium ADurb.Bin243]